MASIDFNPLVPGRFGRMILMRRRGRVFFARPPIRRSGPTPGEVQARQRFREAAVYSKQVFDHATRRAPYAALPEAKEKGVYALILGDFLPRPLIRSVELADYHGQVGDRIRVQPRRDVGIAKVVIALQRADGTPIETGEAPADGGVFAFAATQAVPAGTAVVAEVTATDVDALVFQRTVSFVVG